MMTAIIFMCDIMGTYYTTSQDVNRIKKIENLIINLNSLRENHNADVVLFSFVSTGDVEFVKSFTKEFNTYKIDNIINKINFYENGYIIQNNKTSKIVETKGSFKTSKIINFTKEMEKTFKINALYYADDTNMNHQIFLHYIKNLKDYNYETYDLIINENNDDTDNIIFSNQESIDGLNECIEKVKRKRTIPKEFHLG